MEWDREKLNQTQWHPQFPNLIKCRTTTKVISLRTTKNYQKYSKTSLPSIWNAGYYFFRCFNGILCHVIHCTKHSTASIRRNAGNNVIHVPPSPTLDLVLQSFLLNVHISCLFLWNVPQRSRLYCIYTSSIAASTHLCRGLEDKLFFRVFSPSCIKHSAAILDEIMECRVRLLVAAEPNLNLLWNFDYLSDPKKKNYSHKLQFTPVKDVSCTEFLSCSLATNRLFKKIDVPSPAK